MAASPPQQAIGSETFKRLVDENAALNTNLKRVVEDKLELSQRFEAAELAKDRLVRAARFKDDEIHLVKKKLGQDRHLAEEAEIAKKKAQHALEVTQKELEAVRLQNEQLRKRAERTEDSRTQAWEAVATRDKQLQTLQAEHTQLLDEMKKPGPSTMVVQPDGAATESTSSPTKAKKSAHPMDEPTEYPEFLDPDFKGTLERAELGARSETHMARMEKEKRLFLDKVRFAEENLRLKQELQDLTESDSKMRAEHVSVSQKLIHVENNYNHVLSVLDAEQKRRHDFGDDNDRLKLQVKSLTAELEFTKKQLGEASRQKMTTKLVAAESVHEFTMEMKEMFEKVRGLEATMAKSAEVVAGLEAKIVAKDEAIEELEKKVKETEEARDEYVGDWEAAERKYQNLDKEFQKEASVRFAVEKEISEMKDEVYRTRKILQAEVEKNAELHNQEDEINNLKEKNQQVVQIWRSEEAQLLRAKQEVQAAQEQLAAFESKNANLRKMLSEQEAQVLAAEETKNSVNQQREDMIAEMEGLNKTLAAETAAKAQMIKRARDLEKELKETAAAKATLEARVDTFRKEMEHMEELTQANKELLEKNKHLGANNTRLEGENENFRKELRHVGVKQMRAEEAQTKAEKRLSTEQEQRRKAFADCRAKTIECDDLARLLVIAKKQNTLEETGRVKALEEAAQLGQRCALLQSQLDHLDSKLNITEHLRSVDLEDAHVLESTMWAYSEEFQRKVRVVEETRTNAHDEIKRLSALIRRLTAENFALLKRQKDKQSKYVDELEQMKMQDDEVKELRKQLRKMTNDYDSLQRRNNKIEREASKKSELYASTRKEKSLLEVRLAKQKEAIEKQNRTLRETEASHGKFVGAQAEDFDDLKSNIRQRDDMVQLQMERRLVEHLQERVRAESYEADKLKYEMKEKEEALHDMRRSLQFGAGSEAGSPEALRASGGAVSSMSDTGATTGTPSRDVSASILISFDDVATPGSNSKGKKVRGKSAKLPKLQRNDT